jgi:hypothetical protein
MQFTILAYDDILWVQWTEELGRQGSPVHVALCDALEPIRGVDTVAAHRYEVGLTLVPRVRALAHVLADVESVLLDDPEIRYHIRRALGDDAATISLDMSRSR